MSCLYFKYVSHHAACLIIYYDESVNKWFHQHPLVLTSILSWSFLSGVVQRGLDTSWGAVEVGHGFSTHLPHHLRHTQTGGNHCNISTWEQTNCRLDRQRSLISTELTAHRTKSLLCMSQVLSTGEEVKTNKFWVKNIKSKILFQAKTNFVQN